MGVEVFLERFLFRVTRRGCSPRFILYPCISPWREQQFDQCDQRGRGTLGVRPI